MVAERCEELAVLVGDVGCSKEVGAVGEGFGERCLMAPAADGEVVAVAERLGDGNAEEFGGAGVVGVVEQAAGAVGGAGYSGCGHGVFGAIAFAEAFEF